MRDRIDQASRTPVGRTGVALLSLFIAAAPYILFFDPVDWWPLRPHVVREPLSIYLLFSDDIAYVSAAHNWQQTIAHLFEPHNTHIVPAWRLITFALVRAAGNLERLPTVFAFASYSILLSVMFLTAAIVSRETGAAAIGLAAMALVGTTSVMLTPAIWYSAGQPLWAGFGILATLWYAQSYRLSGKFVTLMMAGVSTVLAGWFWTIGNAAGPVAAVYLWQDGRHRCRFAAIVPLAAMTLSVGIALGMGANRIDPTISFHGRDVLGAANPVRRLAPHLSGHSGELAVRQPWPHRPHDSKPGRAAVRILDSRLDQPCLVSSPSNIRPTAVRSARICRSGDDLRRLRR